MAGGVMKQIINRIQRALAYHGVRGTFRMFANLVRRSFGRTDKARSCGSPAASNPDVEFDRKWGVDTSGILVTDKSDAVGSNWIFGTKYQGCSASDLEQVLNDFHLQHSEFTFIDFGSGKGRGVLIAALFPFKRIIGVEYSEQLCEIARLNWKRFPADAKRCREIEVVCADAAEYPIPGGPLVLFFNNPFGRPILGKVIRNIAASFQQAPRRIMVVYFNAKFPDLWRAAGFMKEVMSSKNTAIFDTRPVAP
jgi:predicted RNA methylase